MANFTISRVTNLSTAEPPADLKFRKKTKGNLVICLFQRLSKAGVARSLDLEHGLHILPFPV